MSDRRDLHKIAADLVDFINKNPTDRGKGRGPGHDVSNEPRVPKGNSDGGQWTTGGSSGGGRTSDEGASADEAGATCPNGYEIVPMEVTAYTNGPESTGKRPGHPQYGITFYKSKAGPGTIAAPPEYAHNTRMYVPGYGWGSVQDTGGAIKGNHLDVWFETVEEARKWGRRKINVIVCKG